MRHNHYLDLGNGSNKFGKHCFITLGQCFSTAVQWNLGVPRMAARGSADTDRSCLGRNSQPQICAVVAI